MSLWQVADGLEVHAVFPFIIVYDSIVFLADKPIGIYAAIEVGGFQFRGAMARYHIDVAQKILPYIQGGAEPIVYHTQLISVLEVHFGIIDRRQFFENSRAYDAACKR